MMSEITDVMALYILDIGTDSVEKLRRNIWDDLCFFSSADYDSYGLDVIVNPRDGYIDFDKDGNGIQPIAYVTMAGHVYSTYDIVTDEIKRFEDYMNTKYSIIDHISRIKQR